LGIGPVFQMRVAIGEAQFEGIGLVDAGDAEEHIRLRWIARDQSSLLKGRVRREAIASSTLILAVTIAATASEIGISMPYFAASATTAVAEKAPSLTELRLPRISSSDLPSPSAMPSDMLRDWGELQVR